MLRRLAGVLSMAVSLSACSLSGSDGAPPPPWVTAPMNRPAPVAALSRMDKGEADVLMVSKLDRLSRSVKDFGALLDRAGKRKWSVLCLDLGVDTTTPVGSSRPTSSHRPVSMNGW
jgi:hypothetical protein